MKRARPKPVRGGGYQPGTVLSGPHAGRTFKSFEEEAKVLGSELPLAFTRANARLRSQGKIS
jgi:hypothetical protein